MWWKTFNIFRSNIALIAVYSIAFVAMDAHSEWDGHVSYSGAQLGMLTVFVYAMFVGMHLERPLSLFERFKKGLWSFTWRSLALLAMITGSAIALAFYVGFFRLERAQAVGATFVLLLLLALVTISLIGTWLPAAVAGSDRSLRAAFKRGRHVFGYTLSRLFVGLGIAQALCLAPLGILPVHFGIPTTLFDAHGMPNVLILVFRLFGSVVGVFFIVMFAVVLWEAFSRAEAIVGSPPDEGKLA